MRLIAYHKMTTGTCVIHCLSELESISVKVSRLKHIHIIQIHVYFPSLCLSCMGFIVDVFVFAVLTNETVQSALQQAQGASNELQKQK